MTKFISNIIWYFICLFSLLPRGFFYCMSDVCAFLLMKVFKYRTSVVYVNLARSFPDLKYRELASIAKEYYTYMCDLFVESIWAVSASPKQLCSMIAIKNPELLDEICSRHDKVVIMLGHRGNWELLGAICGTQEYKREHCYTRCKMKVSYKKANSAVSNIIFEKMRMQEYKKFKASGQIVSSKSLLRDIIKEKEKSIYMFIADQTPVRGRGVAKFLNQKTLMFTGAEDITSKLNLPVVYLCMDRVKRGKYEMSFSVIAESPKDTPRCYITREYARLLERDILREKANWLWSHRRWKRDLTPEEENEYSRL